MKKIERLGVALLLVFCVACNDDSMDGGNGNARCDFITGGNSSVSSNGPVSNANAAADGDMSSFASLNLNVASRSATIRVTAQEGVAFAAGSRVGAFVTFRNQGSSNATTIQTYLEGALVERANVTNSFFEPTGEGTTADFYAGFTTSVAFDAVEFGETDNGSSGNPDYRVYEICSDGSVE